jgi:hypothetical protein
MSVQVQDVEPKELITEYLEQGRGEEAMILDRILTLQNKDERNNPVIFISKNGSGVNITSYCPREFLVKSVLHLITQFNPVELVILTLTIAGLTEDTETANPTH